MSQSYGGGQGNPPAGWYPDGQGSERWWDGQMWTHHVRALAPAEPVLTPQARAFEPYRQGGDVTRVAGYAQLGGHGAGVGQPDNARGLWQSTQGQQADQDHYRGGSSGTAGKKSHTKIWLFGGLGALALFVIAVVVIGLIGAGSGGPRDVVEDYTSAAQANDCDRIKDLVTDRWVADGGWRCLDAEEFEKLKSQRASSDVETSLEIGEEAISGDQATVPATNTITANGETTTLQSAYHLVKTDDGWLIDWVEGIGVPEVSPDGGASPGPLDGAE